MRVPGQDFVSAQQDRQVTVAMAFIMSIAVIDGHSDQLDAEALQDRGPGAAWLGHLISKERA